MSNRFNPYPVERQPDGSYSFRTDLNITYGVVFYAQDDLFAVYTHLSHLFFDFSVEVRDVAGHAFPPKDFRTGDTIAWIVEAFFTNNPDAVLTYTCDDLDQKEYKRHIQFNRWFDRFNKGAIPLEKYDYQIDVRLDQTDASGQTYYVNKVQYTSIMLSAINSQRQALLDAFLRALDEYRAAKS